MTRYFHEFVENILVDLMIAIRRESKYPTFRISVSLKAAKTTTGEYNKCVLSAHDFNSLFRQ